MTSFAWLTCAVLLAAIIGLGLRAGRSTTTEASDFYLGGRSQGVWQSAIASFATAESGFVFLGLVGMAYKFGFVTLWILVGVLYGYLGTWWIMARPLRATSEATGAITLPQLIGAFSGSDDRTPVRVAAAIVFLAMAMYTSVQFHAIGKALSAVSEIGLSTWTVAGAVLVTSYAAAGGLRSVSHTDVLQGGLMLISLSAVAGVAIVDAGGPGAILAAMEAASPALVDLTGGGGGASAVLLPFFFAIVGLGLTGAPHFLRKFIVTQDGLDTRRAGVVATTSCMVLFVAAIAIGFAAHVLLTDPGDPESIVPQLAVSLFPGGLALVTGLVFASLISAMASTGDSQLLEATSALTEDITERSLPRRWVLCGVGMLALAFALVLDESIFSRTLTVWAITGAAFGPAMLLGVLGVRAGPRTYVLAMLAGTATVCWWEFASHWNHDVYALVPGFGISAAIVLIGRRHDPAAP